MSGSKTPTTSTIPTRTPPAAPKQDKTSSFKFPEREESKEENPFDNTEWDKELSRRAQTEGNTEVDIENEYDLVMNTEGDAEEF